MIGHAVLIDEVLCPMIRFCDRREGNAHGGLQRPRPHAIGTPMRAAGNKHDRFRPKYHNDPRSDFGSATLDPLVDLRQRATATDPLQMNSSRDLISSSARASATTPRSHAKREESLQGHPWLSRRNFGPERDPARCAQGRARARAPVSPSPRRLRKCDGAAACVR